MSVAVALKSRCPIEFDHESPEHAVAWAEQFRELRATCPIGWTEKHGGYWVATRYDDVLKIAQNPEGFTSHKSFNPETGEVKGGITLPPFATPRGIPIECDSPEWDVYRSLLNRQLSPKAVEERRQRTGRFAAALIDRVIETGRFDIVDDLTNPLPALTTMAMFGLPLHDWRRFAHPLHTMMYSQKDSAKFAGAMVDLAWIRERIDEVVRKRRTEPQDDFLSYLANAEIDGAKLNDATVWELAWNVITGGVDTTTALTSNVLLYLGRNPEMRRFLIEHPDALPIAREEFVRFFSPIHGFARNATATVDIRGQTIGAGERVYISYAAANRDPEVFDNPETVMIDRFPNRHVGFGAGKHRCVGSFQARMMFEAMMLEVLTRIPDYHIVEGQNRSYPSVGIINGWISIPATFAPGSKVGAIIS